MRKRNRHVSVWLTDKELEHLKEQARQVGMGVDPFIRNLIESVELRPRPPETYAALLRELAAIGNNMNQIAHSANAKIAVTNAEISEAHHFARTWKLHNKRENAGYFPLWQRIIRRPTPVKAGRLLAQPPTSRPVCGLGGP